MRPDLPTQPRAPRVCGSHGLLSSIRTGLLPLLLVGWTTSALAESSVTLVAPDMLRAMGATTFDETGRAVGRSSFEVEPAESGAQTMRVLLSIDGGGSNVSEATLAPIAAAAAAGGRAGATANDGLLGGTGVALRLVEERSQSRSADGRTFPLLVIDHERRRVSCYPAGEPESAGRHTDIPEEDRVVNVPMQLLFLPLVRGEVDSVRFQIATCSDGPVLYDMIAVRGPTTERDGRRVVEVEYGPDFGKTVAWLASRLLPSFSFWFDAEDGSYLGHRMPLHRKGPEVTLVRQGLTPAEIGAD